MIGTKIGEQRMKKAFNLYYRKVDAYEANENYEYYCPVCKSPMILKRGRIRRWHYAHPKGFKCIYKRRINN